MVVTTFAAVSTASAVLALSKTAWKLGSSLSTLDQGTEIVDISIKDLAGEVKSLSNECDLVHAELEEVASKGETGSPPPYDVDGRMWNCLATEVEETSRTMQELKLFVKSLKGKSTFIGQVQGQRKLHNSKDQIANIKTRVCRHTDNLRTTLLLINTVVSHIAPGRADRELARELDKLQDMIEKLQKSSEVNPQSRLSHTETTLMQCAREVIEASQAAESVAGGQGAANNNIRVAEWVSTLESIRRDDQRHSVPSDMISNVPSVFSGDEAHTAVTKATSTQHAVQESETVDAVEDESDDDLDTDLAKAALDTGAKAFEAQEWEEADSLLQEALRVLQQLPKEKRAFCDIFGLQYKLAVCTYHRQEPPAAEEALMSLVQQSVSSDEQRGYICDAAHLLSLLYIRMGQVDRARLECEKALQARRRLLGKRSDASLESTALLAHIYALLNNRARAKSYVAMIPEERRDTVLNIVEESLGRKVESVDSPSIPTRPISEESDMAVNRIQSNLSESSLTSPMESRSYGPVSSMIPQSPASSFRQPRLNIPPNKVGFEDQQSVTVTSPSLAEERTESRGKGKEKSNEHDSTEPEALSPCECVEANDISKSNTLSRKEILEKIGCQPKDRIEEAVCEGDHSAFDNLLNKKKGFWRSNLRKRVRPERVTALHFAALFGEIDMAQRLLSSNYNINEVPFGYSTSLTPLKFAIGARQVKMVEFLIANGARPSEPDSWSTLAGQLMNRSWLSKTMSENEREYVPSRIITILGILLRHGWDVNAPFETSGRTVLHQAVGFWTGSYMWDLNLRAVVTLFLCERGANPFQVDTDGKTPYNMALASGHQDLLLVLDRALRSKEPMEPVELSG